MTTQRADDVRKIALLLLAFGGLLGGLVALLAGLDGLARIL